MQKTIGLADLQHELRAIFEEVVGEGVEYVLTRSDRPEAVLIRYDEFLDLLEGQQREEPLQQTERRSLRLRERSSPETYATMLASEQVLRRDWDSPEEDAAWVNL